MTTELAIRPDQSAFDDKQLAALRSIGVANAPNAELAIFFHQAARTGLDPFSRQIYLINRGGKYTIQVAIDGFRLIRDRKGTYRGHTEEWCGPDGQWADVWLDPKTPPAAARVLIYVDGYVKPVPGVALYSEYAQMGRDGKPQALWASKPALMLAKCAEALALRKAYSQDLSGLYTNDELPVAEQDADGVYVTTMMRRDPEPEQPQGTRNGHASEARVPHEPETKVRPSGPKRQTRSRTDPVAGTADQTRAKEVVAAEWAERVRDCTDLGALFKLHDEAANRNVLDHKPFRSDGRSLTVEELFLARRTELQQAAAGEPELAIHLSDDEAVYSDDASVPF